jgi:PKD repeat protein
MYLRALIIATLCGLSFGAPARAERIVEVWRGPFGVPRSLSVNPTDGSVWAATGSMVMHIASDGTVLNKLVGFSQPKCVSVNSADGSCWVGDSRNHRLVHLSADGVQLLELEVGYVYSVAVNPTDGSCWVGTPADSIAGDYLVHLSADGEEIWRRDAFRIPESIAVNPSDGSCWVRAGSEVAHVSAEGEELWRGGSFFGPESLSVDPNDGSCWVADRFHDRVVQLSAEGEQLRSIGGFSEPMAVSVNPTDGSVWVADWDNMDIVHLSAEGVQLWRGAMPYLTWSVAVNPTDGSCWIGDYTVAHVSAEGAELWRGSGFSNVYGISVNSADGSCWVADFYHSGVVHLSAEGTELWRGESFRRPTDVSADPTDGSCWVADNGNRQVVHLSSEHEELWRGGGVSAPYAVSVNPTDGSCWVAERSNNQVVHLSEAGVELWRGGGFTLPQAVSVDPTDGSCWVAEASDRVTHLSALGAVLSRPSTCTDPDGVSVNPTDGSCWVAGSSVAHLSAAGQVLWHNDDFSAEALSVDPNDGSVWVADTFQCEVAHLSQAGTELSRRGGFYYPWAISVNPADSSCWVADTDNNQIVHLVLVPDITPTAAFTATPTSGPAPLQVTFIDLSSNFPTSWSWDFGDAETSTEQNPTHFYNTPGLYTVSLTAGNDAGSTTETKADYIAVKPEAAFFAYPKSGSAPLKVFFTDTSPGDPTAWAWTFGDGGTSSAENPMYQYESAGFYTVSLTASNAGGSDTETKVDYITVAFPDADLDWWACGEILACVDAGIVAGYPDGTYQPTAAVTRDQMAVYISRALTGGDENVPDPSGEPTFPDVLAGDWAYKHIEYAAAQNVVAGYEDDLYHPEYEVTRDQMAVYVARSMVAPSGEAALADYLPTTPRDFPDVPSDRWGWKHIEYCVEHDVVAGYEDGLYHPADPVTRDQMAVYVARAFGLM